MFSISIQYVYIITFAHKSGTLLRGVSQQQFVLLVTAPHRVSNGSHQVSLLGKVRFMVRIRVKVRVSVADQKSKSRDCSLASDLVQASKFNFINLILNNLILDFTSVVSKSNPAWEGSPCLTPTLWGEGRTTWVNSGVYF